MNNLAIIPARGGSKRIPRKNIRDFLGKPIIAYPIEAALNCGLFEEVMVSTDDDEIAEIAKKFGAEVPFKRSRGNSNDFAGTAEVLLEVIGDYAKIGKQFDYICCIYPTAVFIPPVFLKDGYDHLIHSEFDTVLPIVEYDFPVWRALRKDNNNNVKPVWTAYEKARSQDLEILYHDAGQFYWLQTRSFLKQKKLYTDKCGSIIVSPLHVHDIDTVEDWKIAELKYQLRNY